MLQIKVWTLEKQLLDLCMLNHCVRFMRSFRSPEGARIIANGFKAAGITQSAVDCRSENVDSLDDPFSALSFID